MMGQQEDRNLSKQLESTEKALHDVLAIGMSARWTRRMPKSSFMRSYRSP